ncbi:hypothetical protein N9878_00895 [bacterium]|nr:hypothetical protein [bacterium]
MPIIEEQPLGQFTDLPLTPVELESEAPTVGETFGAGFRQENSFVSAASNGFGLVETPQAVEGYDPYDEENILGYEPFAENFISSRSPQESALIKMKIDQELEDRKTLDSAGAMGFVASMAAGVTDPIYLPLMFTGWGAAGRVGGSVAKTAGRTAALGAISEIPAEAAKQATQETRTLTESAFNVGGSAILSGILGGTMAKLSGSQFDDLSKKAAQILDEPPAGQQEQLSMGAAQAQTATFDELELVNVGGIEQWGVSPLIRTQTSPEIVTRQMASSMMETPLVSKGNIEGVATAPEGGAVETRIKLWDAPMAEAIGNLDGMYTQYRQGMGNTKRIVNDYVLRNRQSKLTPEEFRIEVGKSMRNGDVHAVPEVASAAQMFRKKVFDPLKDEAIAGKLLPEDVNVSTATSYLTRIYRTEKIIAKSDEFDTVTRNWLNRIRQRAINKASKKTSSGGKVSDSLKGEAGISDLEIDEIVVSLRENITGVASGRLPYDVKMGGRGPMKERTFNIPDKLIEDFLESDIDIVARQYTRTMAPDVELNRMFGDISGEKTMDDIDIGYENLRKSATTEKQRVDLNKRQAADKRDLQAMWDRLRGTYRLPQDPNSFFTRAGRILRDVNFMRMLGGMTLSAIPDLARPVAVNGLMPVAKALGALASSPARFKMARMEAKKAAVGLDMVLNSRVASMAEINDIYNRGTKFERSLRTASDVFSKATLMSQWNTAMKQFSGVVTQDSLLTQAVKWGDGSISKSNIRRMATSGIGEDMAARIAQQFAKHGDDGTIKLSNGHKWDDVEALQSFRAAVLKDVDRTIVTPGAGEKPLWTSGETGKMIFQFKTFAAAAHHRILLADLQARDLSALNGFLMSVALGGMTYGLKNWTAGREIQTNPEKLIVESLDRSGAFGYFWDINNMIEKGTRGNFGVNAAVGAPPMSRYASRNIIGSLLGPSLGTAEDAIQIAGGAASGEFSEREVRMLRRMLPAQNLFYMRSLLDELEKNVAKEL